MYEIARRLTDEQRRMVLDHQWVLTELGNGAGFLHNIRGQCPLACALGVNGGLGSYGVAALLVPDSSDILERDSTGDAYRFRAELLDPAFIAIQHAADAFIRAADDDEGETECELGDDRTAWVLAAFGLTGGTVGS